MKNAAKRGMTLMTFAGMLFFSLGAMVAAKGNPAATMKMTGRMVYSCMKTESCPCDTEANIGREMRLWREGAGHEGRAQRQCVGARQPQSPPWRISQNENVVGRGSRGPDPRDCGGPCAPPGKELRGRVDRE